MLVQIDIWIAYAVLNLEMAWREFGDDLVGDGGELRDDKVCGGVDGVSQAVCGLEVGV